MSILTKQLNLFDPEILYFKYEGFNKIKKKKVKDIKGALNETDLKRKLDLNGISLYSCSIKDDPYNLNRFLYYELDKQSPPKSKDIAEFFEILSFLYNASLTNSAALETVLESSTNQKVRTQAIEVLEGVKNGKELDSALAATGYYSDEVITQITAGIHSGTLVKALTTIAANIQDSTKLKASLKSVLIQPVAILIVLLLAMIFMMVFIIPVLAETIESLGGTMPPLTIFVINVSSNLKTWLPIIIIAIFCLTKGFKILIEKNEPLKIAYSKFLLQVPISGDILLKMELSKFCREFSALRSCDTPTAISLNIISRSMSNFALTKAIEEAAYNLHTNGLTLRRALEDTNMFPYDFLSLLEIGSKSQSVVEICDKLAKRYYEDVSRKLTDIPKYIEPLTLVVIGIVVGVVLIALYQPILDLPNMIK